MQTPKSWITGPSWQDLRYELARKHTSYAKVRSRLELRRLAINLAEEKHKSLQAHFASKGNYGLLQQKEEDGIRNHCCLLTDSQGITITVASQLDTRKDFGHPPLAPSIALQPLVEEPRQTPSAVSTLSWRATVVEKGLQFLWLGECCDQTHVQIYYLRTCIILNWITYSKSKGFIENNAKVSNLPAPAKWLKLVMPARLHIGERKGTKDVIEIRSDGPQIPPKWFSWLETDGVGFSSW